MQWVKWKFNLDNETLYERIKKDYWVCAINMEFLKIGILYVSIE